jgi:hypothetical protein
MMRLPDTGADLASKEPLIPEATSTPANADIFTPVGPKEESVMIDSTSDVPVGWFESGGRQLKQAASFGEAEALSWELAAEDRLANKIENRIEVNALKRVGVNLDLETLKRTRPGYNWKEPTTEAAADYIYKDFTSKRDKRAIIDQADVGTLGKIGLWATGMISTLADPLTLATFAATGGIAAEASAALNITTKLGAFGMAVAENVAAGAVVEIGTMEEAKAMQKDYTLKDFAVNAGVTSIAGSAAFEVLGLAFKGVGMGIKQGMKSAGKLSDMGLRALDAGVSPGATLDKMLSEIGKVNSDLEKAFSGSIKTLFPENAAKYLDVTPLETIELIGRDFADGKISEDTFSAFVSDMDSKGITQEYMQSLSKTGGITQEVIDNTKKMTEDPMNQIGADPVAETMKVPTPEESITAVSKMKQDADMALAELSKTQDPVIGDLVAETKRMAVKEDSIVKGVEKISKCKGLGGLQ